MAKIFAVNYNKSINDKYGATTTLGSTATFGTDEKGKALKCNTDVNNYLTYGNIAAVNAIGTGEFSVVVAANIKSFINHGSAYNTLIGKGVIVTSGFAISVMSDTLLRADILNSVITGTASLLNKNNLIILTRNSAGLCTLYLNGVSIGTPLTQAGNITSAGVLSIGYDGFNGPRTPNASIYLGEVYNHCLSATEIAKLNTNFVKTFAPNRPKRNYAQKMPTSLSKEANEGLMGAYNMQANKSNVITDLSGNGRHITILNPSIYVKSKNGLNCYSAGTSALINDLSPTGLTATDFTYCLAGEKVKMPTYSSLCTKNNVYLNVVGSANAISVYQGRLIGYTPALSINAIGNSSFVFTYVNSIKTVTAYIDGVLRSTCVLDTELGTNSFARILNASGYNGAQIIGNVKMIKAYSGVLTERQIKDFHNKYAVETMIKDDFANEIAAGQSLTPKEWVAGTGVYKCSELKLSNRELIQNGQFTSDTIWGKSAGVTIENGYCKIDMSAPNLSTMFQQSTLGATKGKRFKVTYTIANYVSGAMVSCPGAWDVSPIPRSGNGTYTDEVTASNPSAGVSMQFLIYGSSGFKGWVTNISCVEIPPLDSLQDGAKYIENTTAGTIAIPSRTAFGTWEFDLYKAEDASTSYVQFIAPSSRFDVGTSIGGYDFRITNGEASSLVKTASATLNATAGGYLRLNTWYKVRITRTNYGVFTILMKGGYLTPTAGYDGWTLMSVSGGSGTNPVTDIVYTSSSYFVLDLDKNDRFANLIITNEIKQ